MVTGLPAIKPDQAAPRLVAGLRVEGQHGVKVEVQEPHQASAALRVPDQRGELLIGGTSRQRGEQRPDVGLADAAVDAVQDGLERPFAGQHVAADGYVEHLLGCHRFLLVTLLFLSPARPAGEQGPERVRAQMAAAAVRMTSRTLPGWDSMGQWLLSNS